MENQMKHTPPCLTCKKPSTHESRHLLPTGRRAYQCEAHAINEAAWGSDGVETAYRLLAQPAQENVGGQKNV